MNFSQNKKPTSPVTSQDTYMLSQSYKNDELNLSVTSYIDKKQNIWFLGKDTAEILGYKDTDDAIRRHVDKKKKDIRTSPGNSPGQVRCMKFINEPGLYSLIFSSKLESAKKYRDWVFHDVLPSIRKQ